jgi:predicted  nucleic acid-binding Zn-ribbon protein
MLPASASTAVPSPSNRAVGDVSAELLSVKESILAIEHEIDDIGKQINQAAQMLETPLSAEEKTRWIDEKKQLGAKEIELRVEKNRLLAKKIRLFQQRGSYFFFLNSVLLFFFSFYQFSPNA